MWPFLWNKKQSNCISPLFLPCWAFYFYIYTLLYDFEHTYAIVLVWRLKMKLWITFPLSCGSWKSNSGHQLGGKHLYMRSHPAISSCTLSYWFETKSIESTGWPRTQRSTCLSLELKACPTTSRLSLTDVPNTHFRFPSMSTLHT